jgi:hypothetical protein
LIRDVASGADRIVLDAAFRRVGASGPLGAAGFTDADLTTRGRHIVCDRASGSLFYDHDGSGTARAPLRVARVDPGVMLTAADFAVIRKARRPDP